MASGWTNKGKYHAHNVTWVGATLPTNYYVALVTSATAPVADTNVLSDLTEITAGNGYTAGGFSLTPGGTDFDVITESDSNDNAFVQIKDVTWTASGGSIPASGGAARYAVLTDDSTDPEVYAWFDLTSDRTVSTGQTLTLQDCQLTLT